jgi:hypothetical protein
MGTSMSGKSQSGSNPLVPPWAEESDSVTISSGDGSSEEHELSNDDVQQQIPGPPPVHQGSNRFKEARQAFGNYAKKGGNRDDLKSSLKKYASQSTGKGKGGAKRLASGITAGSGLFGLLSGDSVTTSNGTLNFSDLSGLSTDQAIDRIAECLTPTSSDSDIVRTALNYALSEAIEDVENFDDVQFEPELISNIYTCYLTDLIFQQVVIDMGEAWLHAETFIKQLQMETQLRELINVIVDEKLEKATNGSFESINQHQITQIQISAIQETIDEWENF